MASEASGRLRLTAWIYFAGFALVVFVSHVSAFNDADGRLFGLFKIDPRDDLVHIASAVAGAVVAISHRWIRPYLWAVAVLYGIDAVVGMLTAQGLLDLTVFTQTWGPPDFSIRNFLVNLPHFIITGGVLAVFAIERRAR
jgi:hypothetical protein